MTDKQIIIDGVDVSGCIYGEIEKAIFKCSCEYNVSSASMFCKDNPNCHYKLYKRKEQEYEELRQYHNKCCEEFEKEKQNLIDRYNQFLKDFFIGKYCKKEYCELLKAKEQELQQAMDNYVQLDLQRVKEYNELVDLYKAKEQECERLKWYLKEIRDDELKTLDIELDEYETHCVDTEYTNIINLVEEALEEISPEDCRYKKDK